MCDACQCHAHGAALAATATPTLHEPHANATGSIPSDPESSSSDDDAEEDEDEPVDEDEDIARSARWGFLARPFRRWFRSVQYGDHRSSTAVDLRFDAFFVFLPYELDGASSVDDRVGLRKLHDATELVALMLQLDKNAWWFMRKTRKPWFVAFFPSNYDPEKLVPKMNFVLHQRFGPRDDRPGAVKRLHYMLINSDGDHEAGDGHRSFHRAKRRVLDECDPESCLRDFKIPIALTLRPEEASEPAQLQTYLQDVIALVEALQQKSKEEAAFPFRLDDITLGLHLEHASDAHAELTRLFSLGVPVTLRLRHPHTHISEPFAWTDFGWRANVFPSLVASGASGPIHTLESLAIHSSVELLSAVAFSSSFAALEIEQDDERDEAADLEHAHWLAYALRRNRTLRKLELHSFQGTHKLLDAMTSIQSGHDPARLLVSDPMDDSNEPPERVRLRPDALISTRESNGPQSFAELNISSDSDFPLVRTSGIDALSVAFIVPGHAVCSAPRSSVASTHADDHDHKQQHTLTSLALTDAYCDRGVVTRFVELFGRSLEELRWADSLENGFDDDLKGVSALCPRLSRLYLQGSSLRTPTSSLLPQLRSLSLVHTAMPMTSLVALFQALSDDSTLPLESFSYYCPGHSLDAAAADAALDMLATNRRLQSLSVGITAAVYDEYEPRFQDARDVAIQVERLAMAEKLALCGVVQWHQKIETTAVGRLDRACLAHVFQCFTRHTYRRVRVIQSA